MDHEVGKVKPSKETEKGAKEREMMFNGFGV